jgi:hypothetical protein
LLSYVNNPTDLVRTIVDEFATIAGILLKAQTSMQAANVARPSLRATLLDAFQIALLPRKDLNKLSGYQWVQKHLNLIKGSIIVASMAIFVVGMAVLATPQIRTFLDENLGAKITAAMVIGLLMVYVGIYKPVRLAMATVSVLRQGGGAVNTASAELTMTGQFKGMLKGSVAMAIAVGVLMISMFFIYMHMSGISYSSYQFTRGLAYLYASLILLLILTLIGLIPIVGQIIVGIYSLVDTLMSFFNAKDNYKSLSDYITEGIVYVVYSTDLMVDVKAVAIGNPELTIEHPELGTVYGNSISLNADITTTVAQRAPAPEVWQAAFYQYLYNESTLRSTSVAYAFAKDAQSNIMAERDTMSGDWKNIQATGEKIFNLTELHQGDAKVAASGTGVPLPQPGLNRSLPIYLKYGYALPAIECWTAFIPNPAVIPPVIPVPICYDREFTTSGSNFIGDSILLDVLPPTLDEFYALKAAGDGSYRLGWDERFTALPVADGDGQLASSKSGMDPNDSTWDSDSDGLADGRELALRQAGVVADPLDKDRDGDGLTDADELRAGDAPNKADSDGDGLSDKQELDGWTMTLTGTTTLSIHVTSDPISPDGDEDGINDKAEYDLAAKGYNPSVFNPSPIAVYPAMSNADGVLRPGQTFVYTTTVRNTLDTPVFAPALQVDLPPALGGGMRTAAFTLNGGQQAVVAQPLAVPSAPGTQTGAISSTVRVRTAADVTSSQWTTAASSFQLGASNRLPFANGAAVRADGDESYLLTTLRRSTVPAERRTPGDIQVNGFGSADGINRTVEDDNSAEYGADARSWREQGSPNAACADNGNCLIVWDQLEHCYTITFNTIYFKTIDDSGTSTVEPMLFRIKPDGNRELLFVKGRDESNPNLAQGGTVDINKPVTVCGDTQFELRELDGRWPDDGLGSTDLVGVVDTNNWSASGPWSDWVSGNGSNSWQLNYTIQDYQKQTIAGAVIGPDGAPVRGQFSLSGEATNAPKDSQPAVASDGTNFLVTWAHTNGDAWDPTDQLWARSFDNRGNPLATVLRLDDKLETGGAAGQDSLPDVTWAGDRYLVVWQNQNQNDVDIAAASLRGDATLLPNGARILLFATGNQAQPRVALTAPAQQRLM